MEDEKKTFTGMKENHIEGRNAVLEAFRSGRTIDKLYVLDGCQDLTGQIHYQRGKKARYNRQLCDKRTPRSDFRDRKAPGCDCCQCSI